ncbi:MAG: hypothetical protein RL595_1563 [Planctomycetota bacterium]|jgi:stearoyl-CoA desaturase (delta-9 desaturase)
MSQTTLPIHTDLETIYFNPPKFSLAKINWLTLAFLLLMHVGAIAAFFHFSWSGLAWMVGLYCFTGCIGITLGYHRMLTHRGLSLHPFPRFFVHLAGTLALQGAPLYWALAHRVHHARSDKAGDPHSPLHGTWWSHVLWLICQRDDKTRALLVDKYIPDLTREPIGRFFQSTYVVWNILLAATLCSLGGWSWLLWGLCMRVVLVWHMTWLINSASHIWGYRNYETSDQSRNLWWVSLFTFGEGWHNNHHAYPTAAYHGHRWWEIDATGWVISAFRITGLARNVRMPKKIRVSKDTSRDGSIPISTAISPIVATVVAGDLE